MSRAPSLATRAAPHAARESRAASRVRSVANARASGPSPRASASSGASASLSRRGGIRATTHIPASFARRLGARRASRVSNPPRASADDAEPPSPDSNVSFAAAAAPARSGRRELAVNAAFLAVSLPLWRDVLHDLGYLHGAEDEPAPLPKPPPGSGYEVATFAGGCFWCMERPFDVLPGVKATTSGYAGPRGVASPNPTYHEVGRGGTGHRESVQILYDPSEISYERLLDVFWHQIDPTRSDGMFLDAGEQYTSAIFPADAEQRAAAERSLAAVDAAGVFPGKIQTKIINLEDNFYPAEIYHQDYYKRNKARYTFYRGLSGRDEFVQGVWGPNAWAEYVPHD